MVLVRWAMGAVTWLALGMSMAAAETSPGPLPVEAFFKPAVFDGPELSPDGKSMALVHRKDGLWTLAVHELGTGKAVAVLKATDKGHYFNSVHWKGDGRLVVGTTYLGLQHAGGKAKGRIVGFKYAEILAAIDRDGRNQVVLMRSEAAPSRRRMMVVRMLDRLDRDPAHILAVAPTLSGVPAIWKVNLQTGAGTEIERGGERTYGWDTDLNGAVVVRYETRGSSLLIQGRAPGEVEWTDVIRIRAKDVLKELADFELLGPAETAASLYVAVQPTTAAEGTARTIHTYDFRTRTLSAPVWPTLKYDVSTIVRNPRTGVLEGVCYWIDTHECDFKDGELNRTFRGIAKYFSNVRNIAPISISDDGKWWLLSVIGATEPETYYLYDWKNREVTRLGARYPDLPESRLAPMERFAYLAADGTQIPGYLTRPPGTTSGPLPLIVMPHGGPEVRDALTFDLTAQFLATRGYLVFQPNFRGSGGYGVAYANAGHGQWGGLMQSDVTDGVKRLIASGQADPERICIVGSSYGGYAALIGGAQNPELYKCVVSRAGVSDLVKMMKWERGQGGGETSARFTYWRKSIGDPEDDRTKLQAVSPITFASAYRPPVLLIHGAEDGVVPAVQSKDMEKALKAAGKTVRLSLYPGEGHGGWDDAKEQAALKEIAAFLEQHIKPALATPSAGLASP